MGLVTAGSYNFIETGQSFAVNNCRKRVDLIINTNSQDVNAADVIITYNPSLISVTDADGSVSGVQIGEGVAFPEYYGNIVDTNNGVIRLTGVNRTGVLNGSAVFAYIDFTFSAGANPAFAITFTGSGATLDSNIASSSTNNDLLTSVTNYSTTYPSACQPPQPCTDIDNDGICDNADNCIDTDNDGICDEDECVDSDDDGVCDEDECTDIDNDGICDAVDDCIDTNNNGSCDPEQCLDIDNDDICDDIDPCIDANSDGICDGQDGTDTGEPVEPGELPRTGTGDSIINVIDKVVGKDPLKAVNAPQFVQDVTLSGVISSVLLTFTFFNFFSLLNVISAPVLLLSLIRSLITSTRKPWGLVLDADQETPIAFATIRIYAVADNKLIETKVSDLKGRYGFVVDKGEYRLEVAHPDYHPLSFNLTISHKDAPIDNDIYLSPLVSTANRGHAQAANLDNDLVLSRISQLIFSLGFIFAIIACLISPIWYNLLVVLVYGLQIAVYFLLRQQTAQNWGEVIDSKVETGLPLAHVKIYDPDNWSLVDTQMTNRHGQFGFTIDDGNYALMINLNGYNFPSSKQKSMHILENKGAKLLGFKYSQQDKRKKIVLVDPTALTQAKSRDPRPLIRHSQWQQKTGYDGGAANLENPFAG